MARIAGVRVGRAGAGVRCFTADRDEDCAEIVGTDGHVGFSTGGTRIGEALRAFNLHHARRVMRHGPVVLLISDGWDRGDPDQLARELGRVRRTCRRLIGLNPLLGSSTYEPLTRGMQAALPMNKFFACMAARLPQVEDT